MANGELKIELAANPSRFTKLTLGTTGGTLTDYQDSIQTTYSTTPVFGRADPIVGYQNSSRSISFAVQFTNALTANQLLVQNFIAEIMAFQYPTYKDQNNALSISRPPLVYVSLDGLLNRQLCAMKGFAFTPQAGFTPQNSPTVPFGRIRGDSRVGAATFKTVTTKFDLIVLHEGTMGFNDDDLTFFRAANEDFLFGDIKGFSIAVKPQTK